MLRSAARSLSKLLSFVADAVGKREGNIDDRFRARLKRMPKVEFKKLKGSAHTINEPDWFICADGLCVVIEMKVPGKEPRKGQAMRLREWHRAGARAVSCTSVEDAVRVVEETLARAEKLYAYEDGGY
jgi:hypothetical protein